MRNKNTVFIFLALSLSISCGEQYEPTTRKTKPIDLRDYVYLDSISRMVFINNVSGDTVREIIVVDREDFSAFGSYKVIDLTESQTDTFIVNRSGNNYIKCKGELKRAICGDTMLYDVYNDSIILSNSDNYEFAITGSISKDSLFFTQTRSERVKLTALDNNDTVPAWLGFSETFVFQRKKGLISKTVLYYTEIKEKHTNDSKSTQTVIPE